jgi:energy-coupling factor transporter ATP-binding protein EcfA2
MERDLPGWMRVDELVRYSRAFYPAWNDGYAEELRQAFALQPTAKIKDLSRGQKARAGLLIALAHRPELLLLDEPSSGLDPVVCRDILEAIIRTIAHEGRTVFFSSHLLEEVERVADHVTMISHGRIALGAPLDAIKEPLAYLAACFVVARARRGEVPDWRGVFARASRIARVLSPRQDRFPSPTRAQLWFEWRQQGRVLPAFVGILLPFELGLLYLARHEPPVLVEITLVAVLLTPPFMAGFTAAIAGRPGQGGAIPPA